MPKTLRLPRADGTITRYRVLGEPVPQIKGPPFRTRAAYAAAHVVVDPLANLSPSLGAALDWKATLAYRRYLWSLGFGVAEAMDTAQRGMGLTWAHVQELIRRSVAEARRLGAPIACGAGTDQLPPIHPATLDAVRAAYEEQCAFIEGVGGRVILMASRALARAARTPDDYASVYGAILSQVSRPVILHWLGEMFDPALHGYWGHEDLAQAIDSCLDLIRQYSEKIEGIKLSLLDADLETALRRQLPEGVKLFTGDDWHYPDLILGDPTGYSHALLGIFDAIAPVAATALRALDAGNVDTYRSRMASTLALSRHIFAPPTQFYKTGLVLLAYLNGHQSHFKMVGGLESMRSTVHLAKAFILADQAGLLADPDLAAARMHPLLTLAGVSQE